ncbi:hypothetical protein JX265_001101 [Neoarthrinium moseri]|uniref:ABC transporter n=1 Tax=Neoarthrinium moseri TaxID=1658444 RepID=A0A9P9WX55_9PEZI|nr:hypothetical protein JX265_001101 [Neoarthrinium moseri]
MLFSTCNNDDSIGPSVSGCRDEFDFTVVFELLFFTIVPSALFVGLSSWRVALLIKRPVVVDAPFLQLIKLCAIMLYIGLQLGLVILVSVSSFSLTRLFVASAVMQFIAALWMVILSFFEHSRSPRPSFLLSSYLFVTLLFDVAETRTFWLASATKPEMTFTSVFTATMALKVVLMLLEAQHKTKWVNWDTKEPHSPEETSGIFGLGVYFWLNALFVHGYRSILRIEDLYPLDRSMKGATLDERFQRHLDYRKLRRSKYGLVKALCRTLTVPLALPILPRLFLLGFTFCQPFFINSLLQYLAKDEALVSPNAAYGFIGASILIFTGIAVSMSVYEYLHHRSLQMVRGCLVAAIYAKATEAETNTSEESESVTLMSSDLERIRMGFRSLHDMWASVIEVGLASWLLYKQLGVAFIAPIIVVIACTGGTSFVIRFTGDSQKAWMAGAQKRVGLTASVIANMKNLKISGLTSPVGEFVQRLRVDELRASAKFRVLIIISAVIGFCPLFFSPVFTFAFAQKSLDATRIFTSLSYLTLLANPLSQLFQGIPQLLSAVACLDRIQTFLGSKSREDFREEIIAVGGLQQKESADRSVHTGSELGARSAVVIRGGNFGWVPEKMALKDINMDVSKNSFTIICGPIASGKSTLCKALLAEIPFQEGSVTFGMGISRIAYCDQSPFLSNGSIRDNITGFTAFDENRYSEVIGATMLEADLRAMPLGDRTNVGSNGITLSGGQKQRVALARALYLQTDLLIFDDVFSGLDADTEEQVFYRVFGPEGLIRRRQATVILCTHSVRHLPAADCVIALAPDGAILEQGSFAELIKNEAGYVNSLGIKSLSNSSSEASEYGDDAGESRPELLRRYTTASSIVSESADSSRQLGDRKVYKLYFKSMGYTLTFAVFFCGVALGFFNNFPTIWLKYWSDDASTSNPTHSSSFYIGIYGLLNASAMFSLLGLGIGIFVLAIKRAGANLHNDALNTLVRAPLRFFTTTDQGQIVNLFSQDMNLVDTELPNALLNSIYAVFVAIGQAAVLVTTSPYMAISYPFLVAILWAVQKFYLRTSRQMRLLDLEAKSPLYTHFLDTTKGIVTLRAFGFLKEDRAKNIELLDTSQRPAYLLQMIQNWLNLVLGMVVMALAAVLTALAVKTRSNSGFTGASLVTLMLFGENLTSIVRFLTQLETSLGAISRLRRFNETVKPEHRPDEDIFPPEEWPQNGAIELKGVSASYGIDDSNESDEKADLAIRDVNLSIAPGEKIAVCGRTGSGKSSLIALLLKLLDPTTATITGAYIDNIALYKIDRSALRRRIIAIPQDAIFLPDGSSFRANLDPFDDATSADCQSVLQTVDLWTFVQERGGLEAGMSPATFSQGQRQLFSLARAVLRRRLRAKSLGLGGGGSEGGILLLDEVSSSVDRETERAMQEIIRVEFKEYTVVAVSHHLDMIFDFDRVVVMDKGEIVEIGDPKILSQGSTRFGELWRAGGN